MKRFALRAIFCALFIAPLAITARAQDTNTFNHGEIGVFADYFRLGAPRTNFWGLGGRLSFNVNPFTQLEAEMAYDFAQAFTEGFTSPTTGAIAVSSSDLRVLHGYFGPKFQTGGGPIRAFVTLKGGIINFRFDDRPATFGTFTSSVSGLRDGENFGVFYPAGGLEFYAWIIGMRLEVGDEMYFDGGANHNLRVTLGPHFRF